MSLINSFCNKVLCKSDKYNKNIIKFLYKKRDEIYNTDVNLCLDLDFNPEDIKEYERPGNIFDKITMSKKHSDVEVQKIRMIMNLQTEKIELYKDIIPEDYYEIYKKYDINTEYKKLIENEVKDDISLQDITIFISFIRENFEKFMFNFNTNKRFIYYTVHILYPNNKYGHANTLIYDSKYKILYSFEPHGLSWNMYNSYLRFITDYHGVKYYSLGNDIARFFGGGGPQDMQSRDKKYNRCINLKSCLYWSNYVIELIKNNTEALEKVTIPELMAIVYSKINNMKNITYSDIITLYIKSIRNY